MEGAVCRCRMHNIPALAGLSCTKTVYGLCKTFLNLLGESVIKDSGREPDTVIFQDAPNFMHNNESTCIPMYLNPTFRIWGFSP